MFERRRRALNALRDTHVVDGYVINRMSQKFSPTAAAYAAGLRDHISLGANAAGARKNPRRQRRHLGQTADAY